MPPRLEGARHTLVKAVPTSVIHWPDPMSFDEPGRTSIPLLHKVLYGLGYLGIALTTDITLFWLVKCYRPAPDDARWHILVSALAFTFALVVGRLVDAVADPLVGYWSDRLRTRLGRRKPFLLVGGPVLALMFVLIWTPPTPTLSTANAVYLGLALSAFFFAFTIVVCPYLAMLPEITSSRSERVSLTSWQAGFSILGAVGGVALAGYLVEHHGYRTMSLCLAPVVLASSWAPLLVPLPAPASRPAHFPLGRAIAHTLRNPFFRPYLVGMLLFWVAVRMIMAALAKIVEVRAQVLEAQQGMVVAAGLLVAALFLPFMPRIAKRAGKKRLLLTAMLYFGILVIPLPFLGDLPLPLSPVGQAVLLMALAGPAIAVLFTLPNAIVADIVDRDADATGQRREAIYYGVQGSIVKLGMGLGAGIAVLLMHRFGERVTQQGGFLAVALAAAAVSFLAAAALARYPGR